METYGLKIVFCPGVYRPAEDSFTLLNYASTYFRKGVHLLEPCTGTGLISLVAASAKCFSVATDIDVKAVLCASRNAKENQLDEYIDFVCCDGLAAIRRNLFLTTLVVFNPPYLPGEEDPKWDGGSTGVETTIRILMHCVETAPYARIVFLASSMSDIGRLTAFLEDKGAKYRVIGRKYMGFFEEIIVIEAMFTARG